MVKIIGIDPGLAATGIGIIKGRKIKVHAFSYGSIDTSGNLSLPIRLDQIFSGLLDLLKKESPDLMVVEDVFSISKYPQSGITLGKVTGVILLAGCQCQIPIAEISVREAKQVLTGNGGATKIQLEKTVRQLLKLENPIRPYHASDAIGLALIGLYRYQNIRPASCPGLIYNAVD